MSLSRQSVALVLTTRNKKKHHIHPKHKNETEKSALANKTNHTLVWYAFYDLLPRNRAGPVLTGPELTRGM